MNLEIDLKTAEKIIEIIGETGKQNFDPHDVSDVDILKGIASKIDNNEQLNQGEKDILTNFLYLNAVMDQGRDPVGVKELATRVTNEAYKADIKFLHNPNNFFENPRFFTRILQQEHEKVKKERNKILKMRAYSLFDTRINPYTMHRWGTVMLCLKKLSEDHLTLLSFMKKAGRANNIPNLIRDNDEYGLGNAIGYKACHLLVKWLIHTFPIIERSDLRWGNNSYEIPLDSNVGGVFMRSGLLFLFTNEEELWDTKCWIEQSNERVNLSAQRLNNLRISEDHPISQELNEILSAWGLRKRNLMKSLNAFVLRLQKRNFDISIGQLDDGFMHIGQNYCKNQELPLCNKCPLNELCLANNKEPLLKTQFYCGTGQGVFFGR